MRELSACDFCDGEAAGVYEVVPGDIPGVSAQRMVLCDDCRDTLSEIVDPLLEAGRRGGRQRRAAGEADTDAAQAAEPGSGTDSSSSDEAEPSAADGPSAAGESVGSEATGESSGSERSTEESTAAASGGADAEAASPEEASAADSGADSGGSATSGGPQAEQKRIERPPNYGKVVRLVENREAGIPRADLESLASSAYGISTDEVEQAIETALTEGRFRETDEGLETT